MPFKSFILINMCSVEKEAVILVFRSIAMIHIQFFVASNERKISRNKISLVLL